MSAHGTKRTPVVGNLPNLIVIGAQKSGTTSLHYYLRQHPQIFMSQSKELNFFVDELNLSRGLEWYRRQFQSNRQILGETSPSYTHFPRYSGVAERIYHTAPEAKLIYVLRDPVERLLSSYTHKLSLGTEERSFEEAVFFRDGDNNYVNFGRYFLQLEQYLPFFDESKILILTAEELDHFRSQTMASVFRFLGVDDSFHCTEFDRRRNETSEKRTKTPLGKTLAATKLMKCVDALPDRIRHRLADPIYYHFSKPAVRPSPSESTRERLAELLKEDLERLRTYTGRKFSDWSL